MSGRYGVDALYGFLQVVFWICFIVNIFAQSLVLSIVTWLVIAATMFRFFSKNYAQRRKENEIFLEAVRPVRSFTALLRRKLTDKNHRYRRCPHCRTILRLPIKKGKHVVNCPVCHKDVNVRIRF